MSQHLSTEAEAILTALRANIEGPSGDQWCDVYLDNARPAGMSAHQFAGYLSALQAAGLYEPYTDRQFAGYFGRVKLAA